MFQIKFKASAERKLAKLSIDTQRRIIQKLEFFLQQENPLQFAEVLSDPKIGGYRFRIGDYRLIFDVLEESIIMILDVGHRKDTYC